MPEEEDNRNLAPRSLTKDALKPKPIEEDGASEERPFAPFTMPEFPVFPGAGRNAKPSGESKKPEPAKTSSDAPVRKSSHHIIHVEIDSSHVPLKEVPPRVAGKESETPVRTSGKASDLPNQPAPSGGHSAHTPEEAPPSPSKASMAKTASVEKGGHGSSTDENKASLADAFKANLTWIILLMIPPFIVLILMTVPGFLFYTPEHQGFYYFSESLTSGPIRWIAIGLALVCVLIALLLPVLAQRKMNADPVTTYRRRRKKRRI